MLLEELLQTCSRCTTPKFAEVKYFFQATVNNKVETLALISCYNAPNKQLVKASSGALLVCQYCGNATLNVIQAMDIASGVAMVPFKNQENKFFIYEKMGLEVAFLGGGGEDAMDDDAE